MRRIYILKRGSKVWHATVHCAAFTECGRDVDPYVGVSEGAPLPGSRLCKQCEAAIERRELQLLWLITWSPE